MCAWQHDMVQRALPKDSCMRSHPVCQGPWLLCTRLLQLLQLFRLGFGTAGSHDCSQLGLPQPLLHQRCSFPSTSNPSFVIGRSADEKAGRALRAPFVTEGRGARTPRQSIQRRLRIHSANVGIQSKTELIDRRFGAPL